MDRGELSLSYSTRAQPLLLRKYDVMWLILHLAGSVLTAGLRSTTPTGDIPEAPRYGHLAITDKMLGHSGVRYRGVSWYYGTLRYRTLPSKENFPRQQPAPWFLRQIFRSPIQCRTFLPTKGRDWNFLLSLWIQFTSYRNSITSIVKACSLSPTTLTAPSPATFRNSLNYSLPL